MTTQKRKVPEISSTSPALAVEDPPGPKTESTGEPEVNGAADHEATPVATAAPNGSTDTAPELAGPELAGPEATAPELAGPEATAPEATAPEATAPEATAPEATAPELAGWELAGPEVTAPDAAGPDAAGPDTDAEASAEALPGQDMSANGEPDAPGAPTVPVESVEPGEMVALAERISALEAAFALQQTAIADVGESLDDRIADGIAGSIAAEVERVTTDELVDAKRNLSLAAHSMAHLALGITESAESVTGDLRPDSITALLHSFRAEVDNILLQLGYSPLDTQVGERFDPNRHRSLRRIPTDDVRHDRLIAKVIRDGYRSENTRRILVYSDVEVHRYQS